MLIQIGHKNLIHSSIYLLIFICIIIILNVIEKRYLTIIYSYQHIFNSNSSQFHKNNSIEIKDKEKISFNLNETFETRIECIGSLYNQSCLYTNLYYVDGSFTILTIKGTYLPLYSVRTNAFALSSLTPSKREFDSYIDLERFVRTIIDPKRIPSVTLYFGQPFHYNIGHALFDGLYPGYVALIRFSPRHLYPFRILADIEECTSCWSEDVYSRFAGLGMIKQSVLNKMSKGKWFVFDELIMGSGTLCQRCTQEDFQLPAGISLDASRLFRNRMYHQHGLIPSIIRKNNSSQNRIFNRPLLGYIIDNKRFTDDDRKQIHETINEINKQSKFPLIHLVYLYYGNVKINSTKIDTQSSIYQLTENDFIAQLKLLRQMDIHITGPGTGQMYQTFLSDGSVNINLGGVREVQSNNNNSIKYSSYLEQYMTSGTPYIKGLYYPINERIFGIKKGQLIKLIYNAATMILQGFSLPVIPRENLSIDGQLFLEMCQRDKDFCSLVTTRSSDKHFSCLEFWPEEFIHEYRQWSLQGFSEHQRNISCPFKRTLLHQLRIKYQIKHYSISETSYHRTGVRPKSKTN